MAAISPLKCEIFSLTVENQSFMFSNLYLGLKIFFLTVENQLIMFVYFFLGRPPTPKIDQLIPKFVPSCLTCCLAALRPTLGLRWRRAETVCSVEYNPCA